MIYLVAFALGLFNADVTRRDAWCCDVFVMIESSLDIGVSAGLGQRRSIRHKRVCALIFTYVPVSLDFDFLAAKR